MSRISLGDKASINLVLLKSMSRRFGMELNLNVKISVQLFEVLSQA